MDDLVEKIPTIAAIHQDLRDWEQVQETVSKLKDLNGLVNCAGVLTLVAAVDTTKEQLDSILDVNLKAAINMMQIVRKTMVLNDSGGSIVNISGVARTAAAINSMAYEHRCEATGLRVSDQVRHKPGCAATEDG